MNLQGKVGRIGAILTGLMLPMIAGCAEKSSNFSSARHAGTESSDAGQLAIALSDGDSAFQASDASSLTDALQKIENLGGHPTEDSMADPVGQWRASLPNLAPPMRGRALGPAYRSGELGGNKKHEIEQLFLSGKKAVIALESPGRGPLELAVFDAKSRPICGPKDLDGRCQWIPVFTQRYRIEINNPARQNIKYYLVIE